MKRSPSPEVFLSSEVDNILRLKPDSKLAKWIKDMAAVLKENKFAGEQMGKSKIPQHYTKNYGVNNLYRYDHPEGYRSCYTIVNKCPRVLDIMSHPEYDKIFGYKTT
jgi:hypothetical protein